MDNVKTVAIVGVAIGISVAFPVVPILNILVEVFYFVDTQRGITLNGEPFGDVESSLQFGASAIRVLDVGSQFLTDVALFARLHKLVGVVHIIKVDACAEGLAAELVAALNVGQALGFRGGIVAVVGKVVAFRLAMAHSHRSVQAVASDSVTQSSLRVQKIVFLIDVEPLVVVTALVVVKLIVDAVGSVAHVTELHIGKHVELLGQVDGRFRESAAVELVSVRIVVFIITI